MLRKYLSLFICLNLLFSCSHNERENKNIILPPKPQFSPLYALPSFQKSFFPTEDIKLLEENNFSLKKSFLNLENSRLTFEKSYSVLYPTIDGQFGASKTDSDFRTQESETYNLGASLSYNIDIFGRLSALKEQALHNLKANEYNYQALFLANYLQYLQNYGQVVYTKNYSQIANEQEILAKQNFELVKLRYEAGKVTLSDYLTAEQNAQSQKTNAIKSQEAFLLAKQAYGLLLGKSDIEMEDKLSYPPIPSVQDNITIPLASLDKRPDIMASKETLEESYSNVDFAIANLYPNLSLSFSLQNIGKTLSDVFTKDNLISTLSGVITQRLFDGGLREKDIEISKNQAKIAKLNYEETIIKAVSDINITVQRFVQAKQVLLNAEKNQALALKALEASQNSYENGVISVRDLLQTQNNYMLAKSNLLQAEKNIYDVYSLLLVSVSQRPIE